MKKTVILGFILFFAIACKAQQTTSYTIVPVEKVIEYMDANTKIPDNTYLKDVNHLLDKYVGTWKGTYNNINYTFIITKITTDYANVHLKLQEDRLLMNYIITDASGKTIANSTVAAPNNDPSISGYYFSNTTHSYFLSYVGKNANCGQKGILDMSVKIPTRMKLNYYQDNVIINDTDCPGLAVAVQVMPGKGGIILTKQ